MKEAFEEASASESISTHLGRSTIKNELRREDPATLLQIYHECGRREHVK